MIRKLREEDRKELMAYLLREPASNLFIIGDVENYGFDRDFQELWGDFTSAGLNAVLLRYYSYLIISSRGPDYDVSGFAEVIRELNFTMLSGKEDALFPLAAELGLTDIKKQYLAKMSNPGSLLPVAAGDVEWLDLENYRDVMELHKSIEEFDLRGINEESFLRRIKDGSGRTCFIRRDGKVVSSASSTAENKRMAMIVGVGTLKDYRGKGYASACMAALCERLLAEEKTAYLFYDNPGAGRIYRRLGFREIGEWFSAVYGNI